ncbi:hypothetical protein AB833_12205 [Chromatiales bacterium (ex Bugula neritina AB1)]|nr:hypothetical protein AB833_12205 [Chromatiales bacterium (ex Bugula neritina AB1)]
MKSTNENTINQIQSPPAGTNNAGQHTARPTPPPIWFLALCTANAVVGLTILTPALPMIKTELGVSSAAVQQLLTVYMVALAVGQLVYGPLSDRIGRRPIMLTGAVLYTAGCLLATFTNSIEHLTLLRIAQGLGAAACMSMGRAIVNDAFERNEAARQMSTISIMLAIAPVLSLAFGGILAESTGWKGIMTLLTATSLAMTIAAFHMAVETNTNRLSVINVKSVLQAYSTVLRNRLFLCWAVSSGMQVGIFFSLNGFLAYQYQRHGYSLAEFGLWFALTPLCYLIGNSCNRKWFVARGIERAAMTGCTLSLVSVISLYITQALGFTHALSLALPCCLFGFSNGIVIANATVGAISTAGKHAGTGTGIVGAWQMATGGIAGAIIVFLGGAKEFSIAASTLISMSAISVFCMWRVYRQRNLQQ